ncbi:glycosyltransferase involved in cell wall biosynthesis [Actinomadura coerulea]|uniref:Glycosyltransferase involved in cell wall biosynthesis n=1 Tax=Actinomadura coerulea TaxID=46159 RepID=A0A7X0L0U1_9ACTN|nr:glycosyltransferase [Actinomadura coerulea]MBB6397534.1 glycosyltransferase involved in cell wall biosynthesis [Actinomadura coerulea]GGQ03290.1 glycosyl transferase [Actinomadura coerulea]
MGTRRDRPALLEIVVPAFNEADRLPAGLDLLCGKLAGLTARAEVIVVDNASTDGTAGIVESWDGPVPVRLVRCERRGKGAAVRAGLLATRAPYVGFMDADMATDLAALDEAIVLLREGRPVVVGSRRHGRSVVQGYALPVRRLGAITFNRIVRDLVGGIPDTQCGFKFFYGPLGRAAAADLRTSGFSFDVELLAHCVRRGASVTDIPVVWRDRPGSTFSVRRHSLQCLLDLARIRARAGVRLPVIPVRPNIPIVPLRAAFGEPGPVQVALSEPIALPSSVVLPNAAALAENVPTSRAKTG